MEPVDDNNDDDNLLDVLHATTTPLGSSSSAEGNVLVLANIDNSDRICYVGFASGLSPDVLSYQLDGPDCTAKNGCGTHVHSGTSCENSSTQGGHWYDAGKVLGGVDPWATVGYTSTSKDGTAWYGSCLATGLVDDAVGRPFVVHDTDGSRISCGVLQAATEIDTATSSPTVSPDESTSQGNLIAAAASAVVVGSIVLLV